ncbi:MAG: histidine kinase dimerization/phosphoacceptor domain -containing protein, partial [Steroidobacteraceae bacterium]
MKPAKATRDKLPWWGRNAALRPRLVLIVGIAMLAPGVLAVLQASYSYRANMRALERDLAQTAQLEAAEQVGIISASREILTSLSANPDVLGGSAANCRRALQRAIAGLSQYQMAAVVNESGNLACSSLPVQSSRDVHDRDWFRSIMRGEQFVISDLIESRWLETQGIVAAVPLLAEDGAVRGSIALFIGLNWLTRSYGKPNLTDDAAFALLDGRGELITSRAMDLGVRGGLPDPTLITEKLKNSDYTFNARSRDGTWRLYAISPLLEGRIFVVMGKPLVSAISPIALQFAWGVLTPLLMWGLAVAVVWFGIEHLVVRWITYLERITSAYAAGRTNVRPERAAAAPKEIKNLGETFSRMADIISAREHELKDSLQQKEVLVREIHHRVKNNLQLVMSLLNLHARRIRDPRAEVAFAEARSRINALATLHRRLYESESLQEVDLRWFLEDLCAELRRGGLSGSRHVELVVDAPSEAIGPELAVPFGLLVTEAITNAYKHAFTGLASGRIEVVVTRESDEMLLLCVRDNGVGFDSSVASHEHSGLGRSLIEAFVRQMRAELSVSSGEGTVVEVRVPVPKRPSPRPASGTTGA